MTEFGELISTVGQDKVTMKVTEAVMFRGERNYVSVEWEGYVQPGEDPYDASERIQGYTMASLDANTEAFLNHLRQGA
jgi:hypothetical protein